MKKSSITVLGTILGFFGGLGISRVIQKRSTKKKDLKSDKFISYYFLLIKWISIKQKGGSIEKFFEAHQYKRVAIYGMGEIGVRLYEELKDGDVKVEYVIDQSGAISSYIEISIKDLEDDLEEVDVIIITPIFAMDEITKKLAKRTNVPVVSIEDVIFYG